MSETAAAPEGLKELAAELERAALLIRVSARAFTAGSEKAGSQILSEALETLARCMSAANLGGLL